MFGFLMCDGDEILIFNLKILFKKYLLKILNLKFENKKIKKS